MSDLRRPICYADRNTFIVDALPGSVWFSEAGDGDVVTMLFHCPCGCGMRSRITLGIEHKPNLQCPTWRWNGSFTEPTLSPSVNVRPNTVCPGWHGWLRAGYWEVC